MLKVRNRYLYCSFDDLRVHFGIVFLSFLQNSLALVNGAFRLTVDDSYNVTGEAVLSIGGISDTFVSY